MVQESLVKVVDATKFLEHSISEYPGQLTAVIVPVCVSPFMLIKLFNNINGATHSTGTMTAVFQQSSGANP